MMGCIIMPNKNPKRIHNLLKGSNVSGFIRVISSNNIDKNKNKYPNIKKLKIKKIKALIQNITIKKKPNFLFDGSLIC